MPRWVFGRLGPALFVAVAVIATACSSSSSSASGGGACDTSASPRFINFVAYSTPREVYDAKILPAFVKLWKAEHDQTIQFTESYAGSTTQAQNVVNGQPADVVALSLAPDVQTIQDAGLITKDWTQAPDGGMVSSSVVVFDVRPNNPKGIKDWNDLTKDGLQVLTPDPAQSGGARWNLVSLWGSALRGDVPGVAKGDEAAATTLMQGVTHNVIAYDKSARDSIQNFESGNGDVAITYENEVKTAQAAGGEDVAVYPKGSILIENPVAVVDKNAEKDCVEDVAEAFVQYLHTKEAKGYYTDTGFLRSTDPKKAAAGDPANGYPAISDLFTVQELGGWDALDQKLFSDNGIATQAIAKG
ncbi:MAG TPA: sulfate ABC transporter substrate-binding protein [Actinomycetota bacterium]|nr:sulfate ABC transporter substrate-binding protein [Actinomycetota bacterium]